MRLRSFLGPLALALSCVIGLYIGNLIGRNGGGLSEGIGSKGRLDQLIRIINKDYVDSVDADSLLDATIDEMLHRLDPHSSYITRSDIQEVNENMQGNFQGIGVEFRIIDDTLVVVDVITGGPSEKAGIQAGDRIISVEDSLIAGVGAENEMVIGMLRGMKGSTVGVGIFRPLTQESFQVSIIRDDIPIYSVDVAYMLNVTTGYIKVNRFAETTYREYQAAMTDLLEAGMNKLVLDLRDNPGGYLHTANQIVDDMLAKGALIVYTEGRNREREYHYAENGGLFEEGDVVILINEGSASASEIIAGAIQDNDRGKIIGRRSFGKGLVQEQWTLKDGSAIRLTVARYYTPSGRCIQKPYENGYEEYYMESYHRWDNGEMLSLDSADVADSLKYTTVNGRTVYGGGGIMPDLFIPIDTSGRTGMYYRLINRAYLNNWAFDFADKHRAALNDFDLEDYRRSEDPLGVLGFLSSKLREEEMEDLGEKGSELVQYRFKALVARYIWGDDGFYPVIHDIDEVVSASLE